MELRRKVSEGWRCESISIRCRIERDVYVVFLFSAFCVLHSGSALSYRLDSSEVEVASCLKDAWSRTHPSGEATARQPR